MHIQLLLMYEVHKHHGLQIACLVLIWNKGRGAPLSSLHGASR